jgi:hypothetical protein
MQLVAIRLSYLSAVPNDCLIEVKCAVQFKNCMFVLSSLGWVCLLSTLDHTTHHPIDLREVWQKALKSCRADTQAE